MAHNSIYVLTIINILLICEKCSTHTMEGYKLFKSNNVVFENKIEEAGIIVNTDGKIENILTAEDLTNFNNNNVQIFDMGNLTIMPGIVDSHVHVNEPGRTDWEGYVTATKAAAAGGITTIVDMPLNSIPTTTTVENFQTKIEAAKGKTHVDVAFWGGVIPGNEKHLKNLVKSGVVGFKCFLCPSGIDDFPSVNSTQIEAALKELEGTGAVLLFHAEIETPTAVSGSPYKYDTFLQTRPADWEVEAVKLVTSLCKNYNVRCHIVHLSAADAISVIREYKQSHSNLTVETCHHYLTLNSESIPDKATQYKCCPPIRNAANKELLWNALKEGMIDLVVSDHSPCTPDLKFLINPEDIRYGDFLKAWGGISSVQFGLSLFWTEAQKRNFTIHDTVRLMSENPAKLSGLDKRKGKLSIGYDADLVVWNPYETFVIEQSSIYFKNKVTPYLGRELQGKVYKTIVRGEIVFENSVFVEPKGKLLINS